METTHDIDCSFDGRGNRYPVHVADVLRNQAVQPQVSVGVDLHAIYLQAVAFVIASGGKRTYDDRTKDWEKNE